MWRHFQAAARRSLYLTRPAPRWLSRACALIGLIGLTTIGCGAQAPPPSILVFVSDTTRADAISAYGEVAGTTPEIDALAADGLLYRNAYANAPWTLPSHTTLFTGLLPHQHGLGWQRVMAPDALHTVAEALAEYGFETFGVTENGWVTETFNLAQGFQHFERILPRARNAEYAATGIDPAVAALRTWLEARDPTKPFFVFVNVVDPHWPYAIRDENPFLPPGVSREGAGEVAQWPPEYFCAKSDVSHEWAVQRGLYLNEVHEMDARLGEVRRLLLEAKPASGLVTVFTSDHGEHFGEHNRAGHQFSLHEALLRVPLVVHGLPAAKPAILESAVQLADIAPSLYAWVGLQSSHPLAGRPLPVDANDRPAPRPIVAQFRDPDHPSHDEVDLGALFRSQTRVMRNQCGPKETVWGDMQALIAPPLKLIAYERFDAELFDLAADPDGLTDVAQRNPELTRELEAALQEITRSPEATGAFPLSDSLVKQIEAGAN